MPESSERVTLFGGMSESCPRFSWSKDCIKAFSLLNRETAGVSLHTSHCLIERALRQQLTFTDSLNSVNYGL